MSSEYLTAAQLLESSTRGFVRLKEVNLGLLSEDLEKRAVVYRGLPEIVHIDLTRTFEADCPSCAKSRSLGENRLSKRHLTHIVNSFFPTALKVVLNLCHESRLRELEPLIRAIGDHDLQLEVLAHNEIVTPDRYRSFRDWMENLQLPDDMDEFEKAMYGGEKTDEYEREIQDGICPFLHRQFHVRPDGDVYPCPKATDLWLGNVLYQDPVSIWKGPAFARLREAHFAGRGTAFCNSCEHAPYLKERCPSWLGTHIKEGRRVVHQVARSVKHRFVTSKQSTVFAPPIPDVIHCDGGYGDAGETAEFTPIRLNNEILCQNPADQSLWFVRDGVLYRAETPFHEGDRIHRLKPSPAPRATTLCFLDESALLVAFQKGGGMMRVELTSQHAAQVRNVCMLSDARSFVRQGAVAIAGQGTVWAGEYGVFPGARCGWLYKSKDNGYHFEPIYHFEEARHIHVVYAMDDGDGLLVSTGDLAAERRLYKGSVRKGTFRSVIDSWTGFTAVAETDNFVHFGTDLLHDNGLWRWSKSFQGKPEYRPFPKEMDFQISHLVHLGESRLLAVCTDESDACLQMDPLPDRGAPLWLTEDEGATWMRVHSFLPDRGDESERLVPMAGEGAKLITSCCARPGIFTIA